MADTKQAGEPSPRSDFNSLAGDYAKFRTSYSDSLFDAILAYAAIGAGARVLDLACGTGLGMLAYVKRGFEVVGVDVAAAMMDQAAAALPQGARVEFVRGRAEALPLSDASFDLVSCAQAFHWFEPRAAFAECARVLRPDGTLAVFWKHAARDDAFTQTAEQIIREWMGEEAAIASRDHAAEHELGWPVFWEYVTRRGSQHGERPFVDGEQIEIEFELLRTVDEFVGYQRSREKIRTVMRDRRTEFLAELGRRLAATHSKDARMTQRQIQYAFLARRRAD
jgi:ubiquinone/menaquinone biosynthesis C-methylase UbiE